ncbi:MAG: hypothetical protein O2904_02245 [bacterium]|nr:hypothetical protein [bacterium]
MVEKKDALPAPDERAKLVGNIQEQLKSLKDVIGATSKKEDDAGETNETNEQAQENAILAAANSLVDAYKAAKDKLGSSDKAFDAIEEVMETTIQVGSEGEKMLHALVDDTSIRSTEDLASLAGKIEASHLTTEEEVVAQYLKNLNSTPLEKLEDRITKVLTGEKAGPLLEKLDKIGIEPKVIIGLLMNGIMSYMEKFTVLGPKFVKMLADQRFKQEESSLEGEVLTKYNANKKEFENQWRVAYQKWAKTEKKRAIDRPSLLEMVSPTVVVKKPEVVVGAAEAGSNNPILVPESGNPVSVKFEKGLLLNQKALTYGGSSFDVRDENTLITKVVPNTDISKTGIVFAVAGIEQTIVVSALVNNVKKVTAENEFTIESTDIKLKKRTDDSSTKKT